MTMKTTLKTMLTAAKRAVVYFQMRSLEIHLAGKVEIREHVTDPYTRLDMANSIKETSLELCRLRNEYIALRPRTSWRVA